MGESVYQRVLGSRASELHPSLQNYFSLPPDGQVGYGTGAFEVAGSRLRWARPLWAFLGRRHVLFPELGRDIPFHVVNTPTADGRLDAARHFEFPGRTRVMEDTMSVVMSTAGARLHDRLGRRRGLEVELALEVVDRALHMTSGRLWLHLGPFRLRMPRLATVTLTESHVPPARSRVPGANQRVDVRITAPLLGEVFRYAGDFSYSYAAVSSAAESA